MTVAVLGPAVNSDEELQLFRVLTPDSLTRAVRKAA